MGAGPQELFFWDYLDFVVKGFIRVSFELKALLAPLP
ncbi:MAG: hypothetical protein ACJA01_003354 [Saprospiraceae bacterium]|jgi:hypothetical protein